MTLPTIEKLQDVYRRMCGALRDVEKQRSEKLEQIYGPMHYITTGLIDELQRHKDMQGLIAFYNDGRDELDELDAQYKKRKSHVMLRQEALENAMFALLRECNVESMKTAAGTAFTSTQTSVKVADWRVFLGQVIESALDDAVANMTIEGDPWQEGERADFLKHFQDSEAWALLKRAASKDAVKAFIEENKKPVPGVDFDQRLQVSVRRK
jgi:hypothetical protein